MTDRMNALGFKQVNIKDTEFNIFSTIGDRWMLITAGDENGSNTMTASWGQVGILWNKPVATCYIRQSRYTKEFVDAGELFTLSVYPEELKKSLGFCGSKSGREFDKDGKAKAAGLTALYVDGTTAYEEAELILVCRKLYHYDLSAEGFYDKAPAEAFYGDNDWHTAYIAEITAAYKKL